MSPYLGEAFRKCLVLECLDQPHASQAFLGAHRGEQAHDQHGAFGKPQLHEPLHGFALSAPHGHEPFPHSAEDAAPEFLRVPITNKKGRGPKAPAWLYLRFNN